MIGKRRNGRKKERLIGRREAMKTGRKEGRKRK